MSNFAKDINVSNNDCISRQALMKEFADFVKRSNNSDFAPTPTWNDAVSLVGSMPSAQQWIPVKTRPMDEEEKRYWEEHYDYTFDEDYDGIMFDCPMPEDGQEVWVCSKSGYVWEDTCEVDIGIGLEGNGDWDDIVAWMPFERPAPWKEE